MKLDLDWMEKVIAFKSITDDEYLASVIDYVKPSYFSDTNLRLVFEIVCSFYEKRKSIPTTTEIKSYLSTDADKQKFKNAVNSISSIDKALNREELYENTERFLKERGIYEAMMAVAQDVGAGNIDTSLILDKFEKSCNVSLIPDLGLDLLKDFSKVEQELMNPEPTIPTGFKWLDEKLGGGLQRNGRAMYVFAGQTNIGKSIILGNIACNVALQGKNVVVISLEMSETMYAKRLTANLTKVGINSLAKDIDIVRAQMDNLKEFNSNCKVFIKEFPPSTMTPRAIEVYLRKLQKRNIKIDLIVLDYLNLLTTTKGNNSYERIKYIAEETRAMTYAFNCPLVTVTQTNRSGTNVNEPDLTTVSESYALGATSDFVGSLWQGDGDKELGIMRASLLKNRFGINSGSNAFKIDYSTLTLSEDEQLNSMTQDSEDAANSLRMLSH
jgi:replicative DNA helicase